MDGKTLGILGVGRIGSRVYRKLESFEGRSEFFTWVYRIAVNRSYNVKRDRKRRRETSMDDPRVDRAIAIDAAGNPERATELRQLYRSLVAALDGRDWPEGIIKQQVDWIGKSTGADVTFAVDGRDDNALRVGNLAATA